jgi:hypothetical protein
MEHAFSSVSCPFFVFQKVMGLIFLPGDKLYLSRPPMVIFNPSKIQSLVLLQCFVKANWLYCDWWTSERCLYIACFRIHVLAITRIQRPLWRYKAGWWANFFLIWPYFYYVNFYNASSHKNATISMQQNLAQADRVPYDGYDSVLSHTCPNSSLDCIT